MTWAWPDARVRGISGRTSSRTGTSRKVCSEHIAHRGGHAEVVQRRATMQRFAVVLLIEFQPQLQIAHDLVPQGACGGETGPVPDRETVVTRDVDRHLQLRETLSLYAQSIAQEHLIVLAAFVRSAPLI